MARAKNTDRAGARRRVRDARAAELAIARASDPDAEGDDPIDPVTGRAIVREEVEEEVAPRRFGLSAFRMPDIRADVRGLPQLFRERRLLYLPFLLIIVGFVVGLLLWGGVITDASAVQIAFIFIQFTLVPTNLLLFFLGGFLAPRASYLVGFLLGLFDGVLFYAWLALRPAAAVQTDPATTPVEMNATALIVGVLYATVIGTFGAAFAAWYRNFLRSSQQRSRAAQMERQAKRRAAEKEQARAAKRPPKPAAR